MVSSDTIWCVCVIDECIFSTSLFKNVKKVNDFLFFCAKEFYLLNLLNLKINKSRLLSGWRYKLEVSGSIRTTEWPTYLCLKSNTDRNLRHFILFQVRSRIQLEDKNKSQLYFSRANSTDKTVSECMRLLKHRAEYEMYADVILVRIFSSFHHLLLFLIN